EAARSNLEIRDADRVFIGHAERELPRGFRQQPPGAVAVLALDVLEAGEPRQEMPGVTGVLIIIEPRDGDYYDRACLAGKVARGTGPARARPAGEAPRAPPWSDAAAGMGACPSCAAWKPAANAARLLLTPTWPRRIAASNAVRGKGSAPDPASAPNSTALNTLPVASASAAMSNATSARAASRQAASSAAGAPPASASAVFSVMANTRWVEAISKVFSGETKPRSTARAASISSEASTTSTSPGTGISASTGSRPSACALGNSST